jgi:hypothetical protein
LENLKGGEKLVGHMRRWEDNIKIDLKETEWEDAGAINVASYRDQQRTHVNIAMNKASSPKRHGKFLEYQKIYYRTVTQAAPFSRDAVNLQYVVYSCI